MAVVALTSTVLRAVLFYRPQVCDKFLRLDGGVRSAYYLAIYREICELHEPWGRTGRSRIWWTHG